MCAARSNFNRSSALSECGTRIFALRLLIRLGPSAVMTFSTLAVAPEISRFSVRAMIPIVVRTQLPKAVATKSVGEKLSPRP